MVFRKQAEEKTVAECAKEIGVNGSRVRQLIISGELKAEKRGRSWYVKDADLQAFIRSRTQRNY